MTYSELRRLVKEYGCQLDRSGRNHDIFYSPITGRKFPVGRHGKEEVKTGTLKGILKDAGIGK